jgi:phosphonate transport system permease protein
MVVTLQMAYVGTLMGALVALPLAALATHRLARPWLVAIMRSILAAARTIPSILWALILIVLVGYAGNGALAGTLALAAYTVGYLGKLYYEAFDGVDPEVLEAIRSTGAGRAGLVRHAVVPESGNVLLSQVLFIFEYNVRASSILGLVGAGGIGFDIARAVETFQYGRVLAILLVVLAVVVAIDLLSQRLRRRFVVASPAANPA